MEQPFGIAAWRRQERTRLIDQRKALTAEEHNSASAAIMRTLLARLPPNSHELIGCYWPFRREFNSIPYMREILRCGGRVALPVVIARGQPLEFRYWTEETEMQPGVWNTSHPASGPSVRPSV
ncbi:MAG TPA: 5-formyltetrahydrofolate cyclo-ligase, partial [Rhizomicrobium sp.]|nr:5-formyltetrahydrofolate cyclo-ligase [Rhizomicrobium sp.]